MEGVGGSTINGVGSTVRKKRSNTSRRPRPDSQPYPEGRNFSSRSSTPPSDNVSKASSDENIGYDTGSQREEFNLNQCTSSASPVNKDVSETSPKKVRKDDGRFGELDAFYRTGGGWKGNNEEGRSGLDFKGCSEGVLSPYNWKSMNKVEEDLELQSGTTDSHVGSCRNYESHDSAQPMTLSEGLVNESRPRKVKLKVGGVSVTRTIHSKSTLDGASGSEHYIKSSFSSDADRPRQKLILQDDSDDDQSPPDKGCSLQGVPWKDFSKVGSRLSKKEAASKGKMSDFGVSKMQRDNTESIRKSKRVPKRRVLDGAFGDSDEDEEIRYLERLKTSKLTAHYGAEYKDDAGKGSKKCQKISQVSKSRSIEGDYSEHVGDYTSTRSGRNNKKKPRSERVSEDTDYAEEEEPVSDGGPEAKKKGPRKDSYDLLKDGKKEMTLTTRQRALHSGKDTSSGSGASLIEFPNGLPPAPPRKQKEKLSEVEQQLKKAEMAQRRKMQVEKAARESQAEAIRKILGQDSSRKKREDKMKKRRDELAQERAANGMTLASNAVRLVMGPSGTVVTFSKDIGLPSIFDHKPCSYPPPREKCAGPFCTNTYKYRDSKTMLPLCSLQCYKAVQQKMKPIPTC